MSSQGPSQTTQSGPPEWLQQYAQGYLQNAGSQAQTPYTPYNGPRVADLSGLQQQALGGLGSLAGGTNSMFSAENYLNNTINGGEANPYQQDVINTSIADTTNAYNDATRNTLRRSNTAGNLGSAKAMEAQGQNDQNLARGLSQGISGIRSNDFNNMQNRRQQASAMAPSLLSSGIGSLGQILQAGSVPQIQQQRLLDSAYGDFVDQRDWNRNQSDWFGNSLNRSLGGAGGTSTSRQGYDPVSQGLGLITLGSRAYGSGGSGKGGGGDYDSNYLTMYN